MSEDEEMALYEAFQVDPEDRLVVPAKDGIPNAEFRHGGGWRECRIWEGYLRASYILLGEALRNPNEINGLIFPALFNLRHAMEVALKWHIQHAGGVIPKHSGHSLDVLLDAFRKTAADLDDEATYISDCMLSWISEIASIDPRSVAFRYSAERDGSPIKISPERWDVRRLYFAVDTLSLWFDNLSGQIELSRDERYQAYIRGS